MQNRRGYSTTMKCLHWSTVLLFVALFTLGWIASSLPFGATKASLYNWHKTFGLILIILTLFRIYWRLTHPTPPLPDDLPQWEKLAAKASHLLLYAILIFQPLTGLLAAMLSPFPSALFDAIAVPHILTPNESLAHTLGTVHGFFAWFVLAVVGVHAAAALRHHFVLKNDILRWMLPRKKTA